MSSTITTTFTNYFSIKQIIVFVFYTENIIVSSCGLKSEGASLIPEINWFSEADWGNWLEFFALYPFGTGMITNMPQANQSAYARDIICTTAFDQPVYKTDDTYSGSGTTFIGWA
jgi:hypothetical protein